MQIDYFVSEILSPSVAYLGIAIVVFGVLVTIFKLFKFLMFGMDERETFDVRHSLMMYLSLALDFSIAKDVIIMLSLDSADSSTLLQLAFVIALRILLSVFVHLEEGFLRRGKEANGFSLKTKSTVHGSRVSK